MQKLSTGSERPRKGLNRCSFFTGRVDEIFLFLHPALSCA